MIGGSIVKTDSRRDKAYTLAKELKTIFESINNIGSAEYKRLVDFCATGSLSLFSLNTTLKLFKVRTNCMNKGDYLEVSFSSFTENGYPLLQLGFKNSSCHKHNEEIKKHEDMSYQFTIPKTVDLTSVIEAMMILEELG